MKAVVLIVWKDGVPTSTAWTKSQAEDAVAAFRKVRNEGGTAQLFLTLGPGDKRCKAPDATAK